ncbi:MAG TPA: nucleotide exchange factor GrpE [Thermoanaerobaculia bacterium]
MKDPKKKAGGNAGDDDMYVLDDTGDSTIEDIEHEMEVAAQQAADTTENRRAKTAAGGDAAVGEENRQLQDRYMRTLADFENYRKRADREKTEFFKYALGEVLKDLIPVLDNFDRALEHAGEGDDLHKGVALIYKQMWEVLKRHGLRPIEQSAVPFDPKIHEAVVREENPSVPSHTGVAILQKGYFLHDRLLRPAMVKVAVGGPEQQG